jgi:MSHA biogenesis protein MshJ
MAGSYPDLLAYVAELGQLPQKLLWDSMALTVLSYPKSELTLTVSTLSLNSIWLVF